MAAFVRWCMPVVHPFVVDGRLLVASSQLSQQPQIAQDSTHGWTAPTTGLAAGQVDTP
ncbi:protein of unknown function [Micropruina glycogenica]|uniref:Uncharacterized protein n=1 Tax=Micropruina glycogenica TaxID=75385 RepID=A0A2N9JCP8_9ACTN|nr:protein of unknown function [Micropruina glycogenica]